MTRLVVVDATPYGPEPSGAKRRCVEILRRLPALLPHDVFEVHWARDGGGPPKDLVADNLVHATVAVSCRGGVWRWRARGGDLRRRHREAPFTHLLVDHGPVVLTSAVRTVVTVHDLRFRHRYGGLLRRLYGRSRYGATLRRAAAVVAVSASVRDELVSAYGLASPVLARNAAAPVFARRPGKEVAAAAARYGVVGAYALVVARDERRKAPGAAVAAWRATSGGGRGDLSLVVVGGGDRAAAGVCSVPEVPDDDLAALYSGARWTLVPSLYEGYSLPVAESLACGTPVIASDIPAHRAFRDEGAEGLVLVPAPRRRAYRWSWPQATAALAADPPRAVRGSPATWDAAASEVAAALSG